MGTTTPLQAKSAFSDSTPTIGLQSITTGVSFPPKRSACSALLSLFTTLNPLPYNASTLDNAVWLGMTLMLQGDTCTRSRSGRLCWNRLNTVSAPGLAVMLVIELDFACGS